MFAEKVGRFLFKRLKVPFFLALLALGPICVGIFLFLQMQAIDQLWEQFYVGQAKAQTALVKKQRKEKFVQMHEQSDPYFLSKEIEAFKFLAEENKTLKNWISHPAVAKKEPLLKRVQFLENGANRLSFQEEEIQLSKLYKETVEKQHTTVEMDCADLKQVLGIIEEVSPSAATLTNRPQLLISEFHLHKKQTPLQKEVLEVKFDLFKREFLSP